MALETTVFETAGAVPLAAHPDRVRAALDPRLSDATVARLLGCGRLHGRLLDVLGGGEAPPGSPDAGSPFAEPRRAALLAGALLHARALRDVVSGPDVARLLSRIGPEAHALGLRHAAGAEARPYGGDLADAIERDGMAMLGAWLRDAPAALRRAALLRLPPGTAAEGGTEGPASAAHNAAIFVAVCEAFAADRAAGGAAAPPGV